MYYREGADGRRTYEISYRDSTGKRRWETVAGNLDDADVALADRRSRMRGGEQLVRSKATLAEVKEPWFAAQTELRPRTHDQYNLALDRHVLPRLGHRRITTISTDDVARLVAEMREGIYYVQRNGELTRLRRKQPYSGWTIRGTLVPLSGIFAFAVRRGYIGFNPVSRLEHGERPRVQRREQRVLSRGEIRNLLDASLPTYRPLLATGVLTGLRLGELLGLVWSDVDFDGGLVHVRRQLDRTGLRVEPKTPKAVRDVVLMPALAALLREHRSALRERLPAPIDRQRDFVFPTAAGTPFGYRNVERRGLDRAANDAGLNPSGIPKLRFHDLRHTFASLLIAEGANVVFVSRQLGHASPDITLRVYAHLFDRVEHAASTRDALEAGFGGLLR